MDARPERESFAVDPAGLDPNFPTHMHEAAFWEELGRVVATFGFLEETLAKAIFAFTATTEYDEEAVAAALEKWQPTLERALTDALGGQISAYENAVKAHGGLQMVNFDELIEDLKAATSVRNALCHGSWRAPNASGASVPFFVDRKLRRFDTAVDLEFLRRVRRHVVELAFTVIGTVTSMGWQFPGSDGPGEPIWQSRKAQ